MLTTPLLQRLRRLLRGFARRADTAPLLLLPPPALRPVPVPVRPEPSPPPRSKSR